MKSKTGWHDLTTKYIISIYHFLRLLKTPILPPVLVFLALSPGSGRKRVGSLRSAHWTQEVRMFIKIRHYKKGKLSKLGQTKVHIQLLAVASTP